MKALPIILLVISLSSTIFAQIHLRPEAGVNLSHTRIKYAVNNGYETDKTGTLARHRAGLSITLFNSSIMYLETGLFYVGKGYKEENIKYYFPDPVSGAFKPRDTATLYFKLNYLELPISAVYDIRLGNYGTLSPAFGVYFALLTGGERLFRSDTDEERFELNVGPDIRDDASAADFGVNLSLAYKLPFGIYVKGQYGLGMLRGSYGFREANRIVALAIGYDWKISKRRGEERRRRLH